MTGVQQGHITVIERAPRVAGARRALWICKCDCGKTVVMRGDVLRRGASSCGCMSSFKHGGCSGGKLTSLYIIWRDMRSRCNNTSDVGYALYGGRGISVTPEWSSDFSSFRDWAVSSGYQEGLTIDRINTNGNYTPDNCRWATNEEQQVNKRNTVFLEVRGERKPLTEVAREHGVRPQTLHKVMRRGENVEIWLKKRDALKNNKNLGGN